MASKQIKMTATKEVKEEKKTKDKYNNLIVNKQYGNRLLSFSLKEGVYQGAIYKAAIITSVNCTQDGAPITESKELANGQYAQVVKSQSIQITAESFKEFLKDLTELID